MLLSEASLLQKFLNLRVIVIGSAMMKIGLVVLKSEYANVASILL